MFWFYSVSHVSVRARSSDSFFLRIYVCYIHMWRYSYLSYVSGKDRRVIKNISLSCLLWFLCSIETGKITGLCWNFVFFFVSKSLFSPRVPFDFSVSCRASFFVEVYINDLWFVQPESPWRLPCDWHKSFNLSLLDHRSSRLERQSPCIYDDGI